MATTPNYNLYKPDRTDNTTEVDTSLSGNFVTIDTQMKTNSNAITTHIANPFAAHDATAITYKDTTVDTELDDLDSRVTTIETSGVSGGTIPVDLENRLETVETTNDDQDNRLTDVENNVNGMLAPTTFDELANQSFNYDELRFGYVDNKLTPINAELTAHTQRLKSAWLDLKDDFGAAGDGVTDDTVAIRNAYAYANTNGSVKLHEPEGTYLVSDYIRVYKNTTVVKHANTTIKRVGTVAKVYVNGEMGNATYATGYNGDGNIHFYNGTVDLNGVDNPLTDTTKDTSAFDMGHGADISFYNVAVKNGYNGHYYQISSCRDVLFERCQFLDQVQADTSSNKTNHEVLQIEAISPQDSNGNYAFNTFGSYDDTPSKNIIVKDCIFDNVIRGVGNHSFSSADGTTVRTYNENIKLINNEFRNVKDHSINLIGYKHVRLSNNTIEDGGAYGINVSHSKDVVDTGITIQRTSKCGIYVTTSQDIKFIAPSLEDVCKLYSTDNTASYAAIRMDSVTNLTLQSPTVRGAGAWHTFAYYEATSTGTVIINPQFDNGHTVATNNGWIAADTYTMDIRSKNIVLFDGDLSTFASPVALPYDCKLFKSINVMGNDNTSLTASFAQINIPKEQFVNGSATDRYRMITNTTAYNSFSFPDTVSIRLDSAVGGTAPGVGHIRKVIGVL